ncbi:GH92 family glycosyl hydrolase [Luteimicrobium sp. DT211]|uniref:GH92 family glycosyl hydrolase n=1 Tax=Luteimicrobium sp. DT211 TaxID=3393412 RepID=UPI003CE9FD74
MVHHPLRGRRAWRVLAASGAAAALLTGAFTAGPAQAQKLPALVTDPATYVDPIIGTSNAGNTYPGAVVPFGMLAWSPQTSTGNQASNPAPGGYRYDATRIRGFSLTHLNGVGCSGANGDIPVMPYVGDVTSSPSADTKDATYASTFSHANEKAEAGSYSVRLDSGASASLTTTQRTGTGLFGFPAGKAASMLFRTSSSESGSTDATVTVDPKAKTVTGSVDAGNFCGPQSANNRHDGYTLYFTAHFDTKFASEGTWKDDALTPGSTSASGGTGYSTSGNPVAGKGSGAYVTFPAGTRQVQVKVAISYVSAANAELNLKAENPASKTFDKTRKAAVKTWDRALGAAQVGGGTQDQKTTFYTALYHSMLEPTLTSDVDGRYLGGDRKVHTVTKYQDEQYGTFSGWDQYRGQVQLLALLNPDVASDYAQSLKNYADQRGGEWDRWLLENAKTSVMSGDPSAAALAGMYAFGARGFDVKGSLASLVTAATVPTENDLSSAGCNVECVGQRPALDQYLKIGYVPADDCHCWGGAAETLEDSAADAGISELASALGKDAVASEFRDRSGAWSNVFDPDATSDGGYMRNRSADGTWSGASFSPGTGSGFVEGSSARYTWMVYSDVAGLASALGGKQATVDRLDGFFKADDGTFDFSAKDDTKYDATNEPDINAPYLYDYVGAPYKTQETVRAEMDQLWTADSGGIPGNDDAGTMSSWYVWSALGMYPQNPTRADLVLTSPLFPRAVVHTGTGKTITVNAPAASSKNVYVQDVQVTGAPSNRPWVPASFVKKGGTLDYTLVAKAQKSWGKAAADAPPSFRDGEIPAFVRSSDSSVKVEPGAQAKTSLTMSTMTGKQVRVRWSIEAPDGLKVTPSASAVTVPKSGQVTVPVTVKATKQAADGVYTLPVTATTTDGQRIAAAPLTVTVGTEGTLSWYVNNRAISASDDDPKANFDGEGWSYSAAALAAAGATPGGTVSAGGFDFTWPDVAPGSPDNVVAGGGDQVLDLSASSKGATKLAFLGSASEGQASGTVTLTYTDGSTQTATVGFSDWTLGGGGGAPQFGNVIALQTAYRDQSGLGKDPVKTDIFATAPIALTAGKQLQSVTLPTTVDGGDLHVFAVATA